MALTNKEVKSELKAMERASAIEAAISALRTIDSMGMGVRIGLTIDTLQKMRGELISQISSGMESKGRYRKTE